MIFTEPSRELDLLVLEYIFGFPAKKAWLDPDIGDWYYIPSGKPKRTHMIDARPVPRFSSCEGWTVVEKLAGISGDHSFTLRIRNNAGFYSAEFTRPSEEFSDVQNHVSVAICNAALKAKGVPRDVLLAAILAGNSRVSKVGPASCPNLTAK